MTYDVYVGRKLGHGFSGFDRDIFNIVYRTLEKGKPGSRFPLFHKLDDSQNEPGRLEEVLKWSEMSELGNELFEIRNGIAQLPFPAASFYQGKVELSYTAPINDDGVIMSTSDWNFGVNKNGLFIKTCDGMVRYHNELNKDHHDFQFAITMPGAVDRVAHTFKGGGMVLGYFFDKLGEIARVAKEKKLSLRV